MKFGWILALVIFVGIIIRLIPLDFPYFTADEARVAFRGFHIASSGKDELGRPFPLIFNSLADYNLPLASYFSASGAIFFGKSNFGARIPFILTGLGIIFFVYKTSQMFTQNKQIWIFNAFFSATAPILIFLSKIPNESIVLAFLLTLLFYLLIKDKVNFVLIFIVIILMFLLSKISWLIIAPFVIFTIFIYQKNLPKKVKIRFSKVTILLSIITFALFLQIPQSLRSLKENNFTIFSEITIKNGINELRGQGIKSGWPPHLERILFNKSHFILVGLPHWFAHLSPNVFFGQFDDSFQYGYIGMGALPKILILPFITGLIWSIKQSQKYRLLPIYFFVLTLPSIFTYPNYLKEVQILMIPFIILIAGFGMANLSKFLKIVILGLIVVEISINLAFLTPNIMNTNWSRPFWIKQILDEGYVLSKEHRVAISDDIVEDIAPHLQWYSQFELDSQDIPYPYKLRQNRGENILIIGEANTFYNCALDRPTYIIGSKRDLSEIQIFLNINTKKEVKRIYKDGLGNEVAYLLEPVICVN